jgi:L-ascorbate metabolism protein UlaG (beta-lactamase superfamily)
VAIVIKWFPPSWLQLKIGKQILYVDPAYLRTNFTNYPKRIEFSKWPDPIDGLPEELEKADIILITHHHKDHCKAVTVNRLKKPNTLIIAPKKCMKEIGKETKSIKPGDHLVVGDVSINVVDAYNLVKEGVSKLMN